MAIEGSPMAIRRPPARAAPEIRGDQGRSGEMPTCTRHARDQGDQGRSGEIRGDAHLHAPRPSEELLERRQLGRWVGERLGRRPRRLAQPVNEAGGAGRGQL